MKTNSSGESLGLPGDGLIASLGIEVEIIGQTSAHQAAQQDMAQWQKTGLTVEPVESFESASGDLGYRTWAKGHDRSIISAYHKSGAFNAAVFRVVGQDRVDSPDITLLLESFEPRPHEND